MHVDDINGQIQCVVQNIAAGFPGQLVDGDSMDGPADLGLCKPLECNPANEPGVQGFTILSIMAKTRNLIIGLIIYLWHKHSPAISAGHCVAQWLCSPPGLPQRWRASLLCCLVLFHEAVLEYVVRVDPVEDILRLLEVLSTLRSCEEALSAQKIEWQASTIKLLEGPLTG